MYTGLSLYIQGALNEWFFELRIYANKYENIELKRNDGVLEVFFGSKTVLTWDRHLSDSLIELFGYKDDPQMLS